MPTANQNTIATIKPQTNPLADAIGSSYDSSSLSFHTMPPGLPFPPLHIFKGITFSILYNLP